VQRGPAWWRQAWPADPVSLYRITEGVHIFSGIVAIPLLLVKLWVVFPRLFAWPPFRDLTHLIERIALVALVAGSLFQLATGVMNIFYWYAFPFNFPNAHYAGAWIAFGGLITHVGAKWRVARRALAAPAPAEAAAGTGGGLTRRSLLTATGVAAGALLATTLGSAITPLSRLAILAPRRAGTGPQGVPVNHVATRDIVAAARSDDYRLVVDGAVATPLSLTLADVQALPRYEETLPISCVEGWSTSAGWRGVRLLDLLERAGAAPDAVVRVYSLQRAGGSRASLVYPNHGRDPRTLLALELNGEELHIDHGWPLRLIAPNRPGVQQTKWLTRIEVL
jgi:DMSO/TMAO reductase YedYZ molybdopterin-dependent catalytic subunit